MAYKLLLSGCLKQVLEIIFVLTVMYSTSLYLQFHLCLVSGVVRRFDTFYFFYWLKNNAIVNKNEMSQLSSRGKHVRKGAVIAPDGYVALIESV